MTISRLRAGFALTFVAVSLMAGAPAAQACTEPTLGDLPARGEEKQLVRFEVTGMTPDSEYLLKVKAASGSPAWPPTTRSRGNSGCRTWATPTAG